MVNSAHMLEEFLSPSLPPLSLPPSLLPSFLYSFPSLPFSLSYSLSLLFPSFPPFIFSLQARIRYSPDALLQKLSENSKFDWIRRRISTSWPEWERAGRQLAAQKPFQHTEKKVSYHGSPNATVRSFRALFWQELVAKTQVWMSG